MNNSKKGHLAEQVRRLRARFVQSAGSVLGDVLPAKSPERWTWGQLNVMCKASLCKHCNLMSER